MTLDLTSRQKANGLWGGRFSQTLFDVKIFNPRAKPCPIAISDAYKIHEGVKTIKYQPRFREVDYSSFVPLTRRNSTRLYKNRPETSRECKRKMELIILGHNKLYKNKILRSEILCLLGCENPKITSNFGNFICALIEEGRF